MINIVQPTLAKEKPAHPDQIFAFNWIGKGKLENGGIAP